MKDETTSRGGDSRPNKERVFDALWRVLRPDVSPPPLEEVLGEDVRDGLSLAVTQDEEPTPALRPSVTPTTGPAMADWVPFDRLGRYRVAKWIGNGGFADVLLCWDEVLYKDVAVKVSHPDRLPRNADPEGYLAEARALGKLDHPAIVPVYDAGQTPDRWCYVVFKYYPGGNLQSAWKNNRWDARRVVTAVARIADALEHAHQSHFVHRDVKPSNILLDEKGDVFLADFGLARNLLEGCIEKHLAGTPAYLSPEQARGEGHRVDPRSDVFSLGAVFYEGLTQRRLFTGARSTKIVAKVASFQTHSLRSVDDSIDPELDRICCKALAPLAAKRYATAAAFLSDLRGWMHQQSIADSVGQTAAGVAAAPRSAAPAPIQPRGLRPFEASDARAFLDLVPGARGADALPEIISFWKALLEGRPEPHREPLKVGVVYGPSGAGKSSLIRAGVLPRLESGVQSIVVECSPTGVTAMIHRRLDGLFPVPATDGETIAAASLPDRFADLRQAGDSASQDRIVLVLDQFERWLSSWDGAEADELVRALRQFDGRRLAAVLIVRDDFWTATNRFFQALEIPLANDRNATAVEPFMPAHARFVLAEFGRGCGGLPDPSVGAAQRFLREAIADMTIDGRILPAQLALFADRMRNLPWTTKSLSARGGVQGVFRGFLDDSFGSSAPRPVRKYRAAARAVLADLLPAEEDDQRQLVGAPRTAAELADRSGYATTGQPFSELVSLLEDRLRLIVRLDHQEIDSGQSSEPSYQLAHDFLVRPLRDWVDEEAERSFWGRIDHKMERLAKAWTYKQEPRNLPSLLEWPILAVRNYWKPASSTTAKTRLLAAANRLYMVRLSICALVLTTTAVFSYRAFAGFMAANLVHRLAGADPSAALQRADELRPWLAWAESDLRRMTSGVPPEGASAPPSKQTRSNCLLALRWLAPEDAIRGLAAEVLDAPPHALPAYFAALNDEPRISLPILWTAMAAQESTVSARLRLGCAAASLDPSSPQWTEISADVTHALLSEGAFSLPLWLSYLTPVRHHLEPSLLRSLDAEGESSTGQIAAAALAHHWADDESRIVALLLRARGVQIKAILPHILARREIFTALLQKEFEKQYAASQTDKGAAQLTRSANVAIGLFALGDARPADRIFMETSDPTLRSRLAVDLPKTGVDPASVYRDVFSVPQASPAARSARLLCLGFFPLEDVPLSARGRLRDQLLTTFREDPDAVVHSSAEGLLIRIGEGDAVSKLNSEFELRGVRRGFNWFVGPNGHTFRIFPAQKRVELGVADRDPNFYSPKRKVDFPSAFAVATTVTTVGQMRRSPLRHRNFPGFDEPPTLPATALSYARAMAYCKHLDSISKPSTTPDQRCYPDSLNDSWAEFPLPKNCLERTGFRLPTEDEWEFTSRGGASTPWPCGSDLSLLTKFVHFGESGKTAPNGVFDLAPNAYGLFGAVGNVYQLTLDPDRLARRKSINPVMFLRGGSFRGLSTAVRSDVRYIMACSPAERSEGLWGFRVAATLAKQPLK